MKITINSRLIEAKEGESILQVARREGIFIPAICYLNGCSPTLACRLCMVEADGKRVYGCNAKVKDGMQVVTNTPEIQAERNAIMQTYCINHPLECGVCDKSGECELQNFTTMMKVNTQNYAIKDTHKPHKKWGLIQYDPALCIVCERCITVCTDKIGETALKTTPRGGEQVPKELKDTMPKDAHAIWSKFQKSLIAPSSGDTLDCSFCGECTSVCPVGALVGSKFQYTSNAWELSRVPASNPHSSDCELIYYDVKPTGINNRAPKIYRVSNDFHFGEIGAAARWGYDFNNEYAKKDEDKFNQIVNAIKSGEIKNIKFNSVITNEEAFILQQIAKKYDIALLNDEAKSYAKFLNDFSKSATSSAYSADYNDIKQADFIISVGSLLRYDSPNTAYKITNALKVNKASGVYFHPLKDGVVDNISKNFDLVAHEAGDELAVMLFLAQKSGVLEFDEFKFKDQKEVKTKKTRTITQTVTKTINGADGESVEISEEVSKEETYDEIENITVIRSEFAKRLRLDEDRFDELLGTKTNKVLIIGEDFYTSEYASSLAGLAGLLQKEGGFKVMLIPPRTNSLGVAKICDLSDEPKPGKTLGYNETGEFKFGVFGADIDAGALNQQEGSFTNIEQRLVPTNAALPHNGYFLNDLANALDIKQSLTINYTHKLPTEKGYKGVKFDDLTNFYTTGGENQRGYKLDSFDIDYIDAKDSIKQDAAQFMNSKNKENECIIYRANPIEQFYKTTSRTSQLGEVGALFASSEFIEKYGLKAGAPVTITSDKTSLSLSLKEDKNIKNSYAYLGDFDDKIDPSLIFDEGRFKVVSIKGESNE